MHNGHKERYTEEIMNTTFRGLPTDHRVIWKNHIDLVVTTFNVWYPEVFNTYMNIQYNLSQ